MSALRDLLFHVQEHRFTIPQIEASLTQLGLVFCGFKNRGTVQKFKLENPSVFARMYQFCCQKEGRKTL